MCICIIYIIYVQIDTITYIYIYIIFDYCILNIYIYTWWCVNIFNNHTVFIYFSCISLPNNQRPGLEKKTTYKQPKCFSDVKTIIKTQAGSMVHGLSHFFFSGPPGFSAPGEGRRPWEPWQSRNWSGSWVSWQMGVVLKVGDFRFG